MTKTTVNGLMDVLYVMILLGIMGCGHDLPVELQALEAKLPPKVDYNFHIRPILADRCYSCHGPDANKREADLRLDLESSAKRTAVLPKNLKQSEAWQRIIAKAPDRMMPPPTSGLVLSDYEKALIGRWIAQGAEWRRHWAFIPPTTSQPPERADASWPRNNPIDDFVHAKLKPHGLAPAHKASRERLIRRLSFDLRGLPPTLDEVDSFVHDPSDQAYEDLIDQMMHSDAYAERMTLEWLDVARYADSHGLHADGMREQWPWRDWVIRAFQDNLNYRDFITWQLAGDMLPEATRDQKLATGFHRNHTFNTELGIVSEEFRLQYVADRTNTTATALMGMTIECAACHDHKFDPISQKEFYEMSAFFNNIPELGMTGNDKNFGPMLLLPDPTTEDDLTTLSRKIESLEKGQRLRREKVRGIKDYLALNSTQMHPPQPDYLFPLDDVSTAVDSRGRKMLVLDQNRKSTVYGEYEIVEGKVGNGIRIDHDFDGIRLAGVRHFDVQEPFTAACWINTEEEGKFQSVIGNIGEKNSGWRGWMMYLDTLNRPSLRMVHNLSHNLIDVYSDTTVPTEKWMHLAFTYDGSASAEGITLYLNGNELSKTVRRDRLYKTIIPTKNRNYIVHREKPVSLGAGIKYLYEDTDDGIFVGAFDHIQLFHDCLTSGEMVQLLKKQIPNEDFELSNEMKLAYHLKYLDPQYGVQQDSLLALRTQRARLLNEVQEAMVMEEMSPPRPTHVLERGQYDALGERVYPATPKDILPFPDDYPPNRLGLAQWLFHDDHPLTARVAVNRYWQMLFGRGLVDTPHDFGSQGSLPSHPALLDWLACEFEAMNWDLRKLLKLMLMSATYRQESVVSPDVYEKDPENIFLARGPSHRLPGEMIRDHALAVSGLLSKKVGGPSVKPYQPHGLWEEKNEFSGFLNSYETDSGADLYRRSMYTFIRRTSPHPAMTTFDVPSRSICVVKRENTSSPLQSLVLLNDPQFVEAARVLAERMQEEGGETLSAQLHHGFRLVCGRAPRQEESQLLMQLFVEATQKFEHTEYATKELLAVGEHPIDVKRLEPKTAALAMVANTLFNFDEAYMKR
ncbi:MAG: DUF1553 domain-containing protein [Saprospiraceae bacterium]|nr:DUF1553 domain-containing protein [Saprospiraceae bacterium]